MRLQTQSLRGSRFVYVTPGHQFPLGMETKAAALRSVEVVPLSAYHDGRMARERLQLGFAAVDVKEIRRGVSDLAIALETESSPTKKNLTETADSTSRPSPACSSATNKQDSSFSWPLLLPSEVSCSANPARDPASAVSSRSPSTDLRHLRSAYQDLSA